MLDNFLYKMGFYVINIDFVICLMGILGIIFSEKSWGRRIFIISFILFALMQITNLYEWPAKNLENAYAKEAFLEEDIEGFILLGGSYDLKKSTPDRVIFNLAASRLIDFLKLVIKYPNKKVVFTGTPLEAEITQQYFKDFHIDENRLIIENQSRNTRDNAINTAKLLKGMPGKKWVIVTSAFHMKRSMSLFKKAGLNVLAYPVDYHTSETPSLSLTKGATIYWTSIIAEYWSSFMNNMQNPRILTSVKTLGFFL